MASLHAAANYLEECQKWQGFISAQATTAEKDLVGREAIAVLGGNTFDGSRKIVIGSETALFFPDGADTLDESIWPIMQFEEMTARGWLGKLTYKRLKNNCFIAWTLYSPTVLGPIDERNVDPIDKSELPDEPLYRLPIDRALKRPLHFPVGLINFALSFENSYQEKTTESFAPKLFK